MQTKTFFNLVLTLTLAAAWGGILLTRGGNAIAAGPSADDRLALATAPAPVTAPDALAAQKAANLAARREYLSKPMEITGKQLNGENFTSASLKGKVVLIYFWASWCPDCAAETPDMLKLYAAWHEKGVEVVGVSSDVSADKLQAFLAARKDISWLQLYTPPGENGRHPLNTTYHVDWIPTVFVIDKQGICRSVEGVKEMAELVPALLAEKAK